MVCNGLYPLTLSAAVLGTLVATSTGVNVSYLLV